MYKDPPNVRALYASTPPYVDIPKAVAVIGYQKPENVHIALTNAFIPDLIDDPDHPEPIVGSPGCNTRLPGLAESLKAFGYDDTLDLGQFLLETDDTKNGTNQLVDDDSERRTRISAHLGSIVGRRRNRRSPPEHVTEEAWELEKTVRRLSRSRRHHYAVGAAAILGVAVATGAAAQFHVDSPSRAESTESISAQRPSNFFTVSNETTKAFDVTLAAGSADIIGYMSVLMLTRGRRRVSIAHNVARGRLNKAERIPIDPPTLP